MRLSTKSILVTGAGGFIGSHLTERLVKLGATVKAFVRYNSRNDIGCLNFLPPKLLKDIHIIKGDLRDEDAVRDAIENIDVIFHLGAVISIPYSYVCPKEVIETNVLGTLNLLNCIRKTKVEKFIHTSTSEVYGTANYIPIDESHPLQAQSPYSASKIAADKIAESFYKTYNLPIATIRPFNTYGPRQSTRAVIPTIIVQALAGKKIKIGALNAVRDFTYIDDTIDAFLKVATTDGINGETINIGSGLGSSIEKIIDLIKDLLGSDAQIVVDESRFRPSFSELERLVADTKKASNILNWHPKTTLEAGLKKTIKWFEKNIDIYKHLADVYTI